MGTVVQHNDRSIGELFGELASETGTLVRQELALVRTEMTQKVKEVGKESTFIAVGGALGLVAAHTLVAAAVLALALVLPLWAAALIVGAAVCAIAIGLVLKGVRGVQHIDLAPRQTIHSLEDGKTWARRQIQ
jgi:hypothetical protein